MKEVSRASKIGLTAIILVVLLGLCWWLWPASNDADVTDGEDNEQAQDTQSAQFEREDSLALTTAFVGISKNDVVGLTSFTDEYGIELEELQGYDLLESKLITHIAAGQEFLPNVLFMSEESAIELVKTNAFVELGPLLEKAEVDPAILPAGNRLYPAFFEGKQIFLEVSLSSTLRTARALVGLLNRGNIDEAFQLAYYLASHREKPKPLALGLTWPIEFEHPVRSFYVKRIPEIIYYNYLHPDLQEHWTMEEFQCYYEELMEVHYRYVATAFPVEQERVEVCTSRITGMEYQDVVRVHVLLHQSAGRGEDQYISNEATEVMYFIMVDDGWRLIL
ncbi:MAG: hypothetical protein PHS80_15720 [Methanothrix sp.]|nr:hypothetical protein [Methanothrix sp.]